MKQVIISRIGGPEVLTLVDRPTPEPSDGEVLIKVSAAGVAAADLLMRRGAYPGAPALPFAPGYDVVGTVAEVGKGVDAAEVGARVGAFTETGGYSEFVTAKADRLFKIPDGVDDAVAVACILNYGTAYQLLHRVSNVRAGEYVLISGAGGGVGTAVVQLSRLAGAIPIGTASASKLDLVNKLGGKAIDYRSKDVVKQVRALSDGKGVQWAFDHVGGAHMWATRSAMRRGGHMTAIGFASVIGADGKTRNSRLAVSLAYMGMMKLLPGKSITLYRSNVEFSKRAHLFIEDVEKVLDLVAEGKISPIIDSVLNLSDAAEAHRRLEQSAAKGKIVLSVP